MTWERMTRHQMFKNALLAIALTFCAATSAIAGVEDIPTGYTGRLGKLILAPGLEIEISIKVAGFWGVDPLVLKKGGATVWTSPSWQTGIYAGCDPGECKFVRIDLDGNGKMDWLALHVPYGSGAASSYGWDFDGTHTWSEDETRKELAEPWTPSLCGWLSGLIVLDDQKTVYTFVYKDAPDPFAHRNPYVQGQKHYKMVASGEWRKSRLSVSAPIPPVIWNSIHQLLEARACNTPDPIYKGPRPADQRINWSQPAEPYELNWRDYFDDGLAITTVPNPFTRAAKQI